MSDTTERIPTVSPVTGDDKTRRPIVVIAAIAGTILAGILLWFFVVVPLLLGDDAAAPADPAPVPAPAPDATAPPAGADGDVDADLDAEALPVVTYEVFLGRDPFEPVVPVDEDEGATDGTDDGAVTDPSEVVIVDPVTGLPIDVTQPTPGTPPGDDGGDDGTGDGSDGDGDGSGTGDGTGSDDGGSGGGGSGDGSGSGSGERGGCGGDEQVSCDGRTVSLIEVTEDADGPLAIIQVGTTIYEVSEGEVFAGNFLLQDIAGDRVTLVYGDDVVTLSEGDRVLK